MTSAGKLCSAPDIPVPSKRDCQTAAKTLGGGFRGTITPGPISSFSFAQKGCIMCFKTDCYTEAFTEDPKGVWWNPSGMDKQEDVQFQRARAICFGR